MAGSEGRQPRDQARNQGRKESCYPVKLWSQLTVADQLCLGHEEGDTETLRAGTRQKEKLRTETRSSYHTVLAQAGQAFSPHRTQ